LAEKESQPVVYRLLVAVNKTSKSVRRSSQASGCGG